MVVYTREDAQKILTILKNNGINAEVIGSIKTAGVSSHDIDILIPGIEPVIRPYAIAKLKRLFAAYSVENTDWGGVYLKTPYGAIDVFFDRPSATG